MAVAVALVPCFVDDVVNGELEEFVCPFYRVEVEGFVRVAGECVGGVVCIEEGLAVVEVVGLGLVVECAEHFLRS